LVSAPTAAAAAAAAAAVPKGLGFAGGDASQDLPAW